MISESELRELLADFQPQGTRLPCHFTKCLCEKCARAKRSPTIMLQAELMRFVFKVVGAEIRVYEADTADPILAIWSGFCMFGFHCHHAYTRKLERSGLSKVVQKRLQRTHWHPSISAHDPTI